MAGGEFLGSPFVFRRQAPHLSGKGHHSVACRALVLTRRGHGEAEDTCQEASCSEILFLPSAATFDQKVCHLN